MIACPKCGRPVGGRARRCGYCGESLVEDYFSGGVKELGVPTDSPVSAACVAATVLGAFGAVALIAALVFHLMVLFGFGPQALVPALDTPWWIRTTAMTVLPVIFLVQQLILQGQRQSFVISALWLFAFAGGLTLTVAAYLDRGAAAFYGMTVIPYLLVAGCSLAVVSCITAILAYRGKEADA